MISIMEIFDRPSPDTRSFAQKAFGAKAPERTPNLADKLKSSYQDKIKETKDFRRDIINKNVENLKLKTSNWIKPKDENNTSKFSKFRTGVSNLIRPENAENIKPRNLVDDARDMIGSRRVEKGFEQKIGRLNQLQKNQQAKRNLSDLTNASDKYREQHPIRTAIFGGTPQERTGFLGVKGISDLEKAQIRADNVKSTSPLKNQSGAYKSADRFLDTVENRNRKGIGVAQPALNTTNPIPQPAATNPTTITQPIQNVINGQAVAKRKKRLNDMGVSTA